MTLYTGLRQYSERSTSFINAAARVDSGSCAMSDSVAINQSGIMTREWLSGRLIVDSMNE